MDVLRWCIDAMLGCSLLCLLFGFIRYKVEVHNKSLKDYLFHLLFTFGATVFGFHCMNTDTASKTFMAIVFGVIGWCFSAFINLLLTRIVKNKNMLCLFHALLLVLLCAYLIPFCV